MVLRLAKDLEYKPYNTEINRFDPTYWTIDYNAEMVGTLRKLDEKSFVASAQFRTNRDFIGVRWDSEDNVSHEWSKYATDTDYQHTILAFRHNARRPEEPTITIMSPSHGYIYRLTPYVLSDGRYVPLLGPAEFGTGRTYPASVIGNPSGWQEIPDDQMVPHLGRRDYIYILDFSDLRQGYLYDRRRIDAANIRQVSFNLTSDRYGIGLHAKLTSVVSIGGGMKRATIVDFNHGVVLTPGDKIRLSYKTTDNITRSEFAVVSSWSGFGTGVLTIDYPGTNFGTFLESGRLLSEQLQTISPTQAEDVDIYMCDIKVTGNRPTVRKRHYPQPAHDLHMTMGFDDNYSMVPERCVQQVYDLGYRGKWTTYVGMSHYFSARFGWWDTVAEELVVMTEEDPTPALVVNEPARYVLRGDLYPRVREGLGWLEGLEGLEWLEGLAGLDPLEPLNRPTVRWFEDFFTALNALGYDHVNSVAYEILDKFMPEEWKQRDYLGRPALSGWVPPSCFIRPTSDDAVAYLAAVQKQFMAIAVGVGLPCRFQIGEPWWWDGSYSAGAPCIYDAYTLQQYFDETGAYAPLPWIETIFGELDPVHIPYLEWLRAKLGASTDTIRDAVQSEYPEADATLLFFTPQIMTDVSEVTTIINFPTEQWAWPNYQFVQIEDYDWIIHGELEKVPTTFSAATEVLGYPKEVVEYFAGFVLKEGDYHIWRWVSTAVDMAAADGINSIYLWAYTQVMREGIVVADAHAGIANAPLLDFRVNWRDGYAQSIEYKTEIIRSEHGVEQRRAIRATPRKRVEFRIDPTGKSLGAVTNKIAGRQGQTWYMEDHIRRVFTATTMAPGVSKFTLDIVPGWMAIDTILLLRAPSGSWSLRQVALISGNDVTLVGESTLEWPAGTQVSSALLGRIPDTNFTLDASMHASARFAFDVEPASERTELGRLIPFTGQTFQGIDIFPWKPNWANTFRLGMTREQEVLDTGRGQIRVEFNELFSERNVRFEFYQVGAHMAEQVISFFERKLGRRGNFYLPQWSRELTIVDPLDYPNLSEITVAGTDVSDFLEQDHVLRNIVIMTRDRVLHPFAVKASGRSIDGFNTRLVLEEPVSLDIRQRVLGVYWLTLARFASDEFTTAWETNEVAQFSVTFTTLPDFERTL